jgi:hypothetical protein
MNFGFSRNGIKITGVTEKEGNESQFSGNFSDFYHFFRDAMSDEQNSVKAHFMDERDLKLSNSVKKSDNVEDDISFFD